MMWNKLVFRGTKRYGIFGTAALVRLYAANLTTLADFSVSLAIELFAKVGGRARKHRTAALRGCITEKIAGKNRPTLSHEEICL